MLASTHSHFKNNYFAEMCSGSEAGSYLRLIDFCITQQRRREACLGESRGDDEHGDAGVHAFAHQLPSRVQGSGFRVQGAGCRGAGCRVQGAGFRVQGAGVQGAGCAVGRTSSAPSRGSVLALLTACRGEASFNKLTCISIS